MIHPLRKRHFYTWIFLGLLLPIIFGLAISGISEVPINTAWTSGSLKKPLEQTLLSTEEAGITLKLLERVGSPLRYLEFTVKEPLQSSSALVYLLPNGENAVDKGILLGQIGSRGLYKIALDSAMGNQEVLQILLYDNIKRSTIQEFSLDKGQ